MYCRFSSHRERKGVAGAVQLRGALPTRAAAASGAGPHLRASDHFQQRNVAAVEGGRAAIMWAIPPMGGMYTSCMFSMCVCSRKNGC